MSKARISILSVDEAVVTPLKFRGWLRNEAIDIQRTATSKDDVIVVRIYMTQKYRYAVTQTALDKVLKSVVDKHPNIWRVELEVVERPLTTADLFGVAREVEEGMQAFAQSSGEPESPTKH